MGQFAATDCCDQTWCRAPNPDLSQQARQSQHRSRRRRVVSSSITQRRIRKSFKTPWYDERADRLMSIHKRRSLQPACHTPHS